MKPKQHAHPDPRPFAVGDLRDASITDFAHGGEGIARVDGHVVFVRGAIPGDAGSIRITEVKKRFARGEFHTRTKDAELRVPVRCLAASHGGGCCDFSAVAPSHEAAVKAGILENQLRRIGRMDVVPDIQTAEFGTPTGWRTRVRLGVDEYGRAGVRRMHSREVVAGVACAQWAPGLAEEVFAHTYRPGAEVVAVLDEAGQVHIAETKPPARGRRVNTTWRKVAGAKDVVEEVDGVQFSVPVTAFWQAHRGAAQFYADTIREWIANAQLVETTPAGEGETPAAGVNDRRQVVVGWDLYGGTGAFVPAIAEGLAARAAGVGQGGTPQSQGVVPKLAVHSVEYAADAAEAGRRTFTGVTLPGDATVQFHTSKVEEIVKQLPPAHVVVLDPPRVGAGEQVVAAVAGAKPAMVIHIGCDPATFARDAGSWQQHGYQLTQVLVVNAFPGTHHFETIGIFTPQSGNPAARHL